MPNRLLLVPVFAAFATGLFVQASSAQVDSTSPRQQCATEEYRQFDFWIGEWEVTNPEGEPGGRSVITKVLNGCAIHEDWHSAASGFAGNSYSIYDAARAVWHQSWVDNSGTLLQLDGGLQGGKMVLVGDRPTPDGGTVIDRVSWEPIEADRVRQLWESSSDGGQTWTLQFDGLYARRR